MPNSVPAEVKIGAAQPKLGRQEGQGKAQFRGRGIEGGAAQRVAGRGVPRADAGGREAGDRLAALVEGVHDAHALAAPARDRAALHAPGQHDVLRDGVIGPGFGGGAEVIDIAAYAREILRALEVEAAAGLLFVVAGVVDQGIADRRNDRRALDLLDRERGVGVGVVDVLPGQRIIAR